MPLTCDYGFEAYFRVPAVRYVSVGTEFWGQKIHGQGPKNHEKRWERLR
jgi:hypothetical protein